MSGIVLGLHEAAPVLARQRRQTADLCTNLGGRRWNPGRNLMSNGGSMRVCDIAPRCRTSHSPIVLRRCASVVGLALLLVPASSIRVVAGSGVVAGGTAPEVAPLSVTIWTPSDRIESGPLSYVEAWIDGPPIETATLVVNGVSSEVRVENGEIHEFVIVVPGNNRIAVVARKGGVVARDVVTFHCADDKLDLFVQLTHPQRGQAIKLVVRGPDGKDLGAARQEPGYVVREAKPGRYLISATYEQHRHAGDRSWERYEQTMRDLDGDGARLTDEERSKLLDLLDDWASPAAPQCPVRAEASLFGGTPAEQRLRFARILHHPGQEEMLGEVVITEAMLRRARRVLVP